MPGYGEYARFYDRLMDDLQQRHGKDVNRFGVRVRDRISRHMPRASSLLELGCGTGTVLAQIPGLSLTGLDLSPAMLATARGKVPAAALIEGDMAAFDLGRHFDVVICVFDTLNHLTTFSQWISMFGCVHGHLADGGIFIFDVVTVEGFRRLSDSPLYVHDFGGNTLIATTEFTQDNLSVRDMRIFEHLEGNRYVLHCERVCKLAVSHDRITGALAAAGLELAELADQAGDSPHPGSDRLYFVAVKR